MWFIPFVCFLGTIQSNLAEHAIRSDQPAESPVDGQVGGIEEWRSGYSDVYSLGMDESNFIEPSVLDDQTEYNLEFLGSESGEPEKGFSEKRKQEILDLHNFYRGNMTIPAANMGFMEWDYKLEHLAQLWADGCWFDHGKPENPNSSYPTSYGQNLYRGTDGSGLKAIHLFFDEWRYYNMTTRKCLPKQMCGHYITMNWDTAYKVGCGQTKCDWRYLMVCHYIYAARDDRMMYIIGKPCSLCPEPGSICVNKLCMTKDQCSRHPELCDQGTCNVKCHNCGQLNKTSCMCECPDGWDFKDCSGQCRDERYFCGKSPGVPSRRYCGGSTTTVHCRKFCGACNPIKNGTENKLCCDGKLCEKGYVLDTSKNKCTCKLLCPGPYCLTSDEDEDEEDSPTSDTGTLRNNLEIAILILIYSFFNSYC